MSIIDRIRLIIVPDPRKFTRGGPPIYLARKDPANYAMISAMIEQGFLTGDSTGPAPLIKGLTWKANDLYLATQSEGVRIRLTCQHLPRPDIDAIHRLAVDLHAEFGDRRVRRDKWYR